VQLGQIIKAVHAPLDWGVARRRACDRAARTDSSQVDESSYATLIVELARQLEQDGAERLEAVVDDPIEEVRFARDSPVEGTGFEPSVPRRDGIFETAPFELSGTAPSVRRASPQGGDSVEEPAAVAEGADAQLLQVLCGHPA
jgi:hypothetical protein